MAGKSLNTEQILTLLTEQPSKIANLVSGLSPAQCRAAPGPEAWSAVDVLAHLRSCADVWGDCIAVILATDYPTIRAINPRTWIEQTDYRDLAFQPSFDAFTIQRAELLALLAGLSPDQWTRSATVTGAGKPLERTVQFYAQWLATHERSHLKQFKQIAAAFSV